MIHFQPVLMLYNVMCGAGVRAWGVCESVAGGWWWWWGGVQGSSLVDQKTLTCNPGIQSCRCCVKSSVTETVLLVVQL